MLFCIDITSKQSKPPTTFELWNRCWQSSVCKCFQITCVNVTRLYLSTSALTFIKLISLQSLGSESEFFLIQSGTVQLRKEKRKRSHMVIMSRAVLSSIMEKTPEKSSLTWLLITIIISLQKHLYPRFPLSRKVSKEKSLQRQNPNKLPQFRRSSC